MTLQHKENDITLYLNNVRKQINQHLAKLISKLEGPKTLIDAMTYSLSAGGKRIRPILLLATIDAFGERTEKGLTVACAIEMLHTYSLIHDDLPAMDDDDLRRGKPTNHKVFGEAFAILAGDALLTHSFELISSLNEADITSDMQVELVRRLALATGPEGMVGGQAEDLIAENNPHLTVEELENIHFNKTGKLIIYSVIAGAILSGASMAQMQELEQFAYHLGIAFQIQDDILDVEGDIQKTGKPVGSDNQNEKGTYPKLLTIDGAKRRLTEHIESGLQFLRNTNINHDNLEQIAMYIINRDN